MCLKLLESVLGKWRSWPGASLREHWDAKPSLEPVSQEAHTLCEGKGSLLKHLAGQCRNAFNERREFRENNNQRSGNIWFELWGTVRGTKMKFLQAGEQGDRKAKCLRGRAVFVEPVHGRLVLRGQGALIPESSKLRSDWEGLGSTVRSRNVLCWMEPRPEDSEQPKIIRTQV